MTLDLIKEYCKDLFGDINQKECDKIVDQKNINLFSSIDKAKQIRKYNLQKRIKNADINKNLKRKFKNKFELSKNKKINYESFFEKTKYKYITIKITPNLYFDISRCGYIYIDHTMFIPNTFFLCEYKIIKEPNKRIKIQFYFDENLKISTEKILINDYIRLKIGDNVFNTLVETNKDFESCFNRSFAIQFCKFEYNYYIKYVLKKHKIGILIYNKKHEDCTELFKEYQKEINTWVIHTLEKHDKDFYIDRLKYMLELKELELQKYHRLIK